MAAMTMEQATNEINKRRPSQRVSIRAWVRTELPIEGKPGKVFAGLALISITRSQARVLVKDLLGDILEGRGGRLPINIDNTSDGWCFITIG